MADVYGDLDLGTGLNDGTTWDNAFQTIQVFFPGVTAGDIGYLKGSQATAPAATTTFSVGGTIGNPSIILGVKSATTNEPPVNSDLIPGWRTGESRTEANRAYNDADSPIFDFTDTSTIRMGGSFYMYGVRIATAGDQNWLFGSADTEFFEECQFTLGTGKDLTYGSTSFPSAAAGHKNCEWVPEGTNCQLEIFSSTHHEDIGLLISANLIGFLGRNSGTANFYGGDFSAVTGSIDANEHNFNIMNTELHADLTISAPGNIQFHSRMQSDNTSAKSSGSIQQLELLSFSGDLDIETTAVRTGGADDGAAGGHSWAMTPNVDKTRDQYQPMISPWIIGWNGSSGSQTLTVNISNSGAADYNDDDVWMETLYPSELGTAAHTFNTNQMDLLATPAVVTDDTDSTWGTGGNNPQKLQITIAPDFEGPIMVRVCFAKHFGSSPETLFVDPKLEIA